MWGLWGLLKRKYRKMKYGTDLTADDVQFMGFLPSMEELEALSMTTQLGTPIENKEEMIVKVSTNELERLKKERDPSSSRKLYEMYKRGYNSAIDDIIEEFQEEDK